MRVKLKPYEFAEKIGLIFYYSEYNDETSELIDEIISLRSMVQCTIEPTNRWPYYVWNDLNDIECRCIDYYKKDEEQPIGCSIGNYNNGYMKWFKYASINHPLEINI